MITFTKVLHQVFVIIVIVLSANSCMSIFSRKAISLTLPDLTYILQDNNNTVWRCDDMEVERMDADILKTASVKVNVYDLRLNNLLMLRINY